MITITIVAFALRASAGIDLVTLPDRDKVQVTIYNSADLTLVRESRILTLKSGANRLQFSWENTLIDPTSLQMIPLEHAGEIDVAALVFPPRVRNLGEWTIQSGVSGGVPVQIAYLTSGLSWRAFYMGTLTPDETAMRLQGYVVVTNNSGEDYAKAQTRLIVGKVHLLDQIAMLARRQYPYDRPQGPVPPAPSRPGAPMPSAMPMEAPAVMRQLEVADKKEIVKEGLSEYFLYTIEGEETIANGWAKRLPSFEVETVPVVNLYKFEEERWGNRPVRFLSFKNDEEHELGETPIPGGLMRVYRTANEEGHLAYEGASSFQYIPVDEDVELNLGAVENVIVEPTLMNYRTVNYLFNNQGNIWGWDEIRTEEVEVKNTRPVAVKLEITRTANSSAWEVVTEGDAGTYEKVDVTRFRYTMELPPRTARTFTYTLTTRHGKRAEQ